MTRYFENHIKTSYVTRILTLALTISLLFSLYGCTSDKKPEKESNSAKQSDNYPTNQEISYGFLDYKMFDNYLTDGTYRCGSDFEPGDYYIFSIYGAEALYDVSDNPNNFSWSDYRTMRKVSVNKGQYISLSSAAILVSAKEVDKSNWKKYGVFLVGTDLPEGDYKITSITDKYNTELNNISGIWGAYQICNDSPENEPEYCSPLFDKQTYISVQDGQYIIINNARMILNGVDISNNADESELSETTKPNISISAAKTTYESAITATKEDLTGSKGKWYYDGIPLLSDDCEWIDSSLNKNGTVSQGAVYRKIAKMLSGSDFKNKRFFYSYKDISELLLGFTPDTVDEYVPYGENASKFIVVDNQLEAIMQKFESLKSVSGQYDYDYGKLGKYSLDISDMSDCAKEMQISDVMLGYIFAMLDEYAVEISFNENSCHIKYESKV